MKDVDIPALVVLVWDRGSTAHVNPAHDARPGVAHWRTTDAACRRQRGSCQLVPLHRKWRRGQRQEPRGYRRQPVHLRITHEHGSFHARQSGPGG
jgi:hypothetical protein